MRREGGRSKAGEEGKARVRVRRGVVRRGVVRLRFVLSPYVVLLSVLPACSPSLSLPNMVCCLKGEVSVNALSPFHVLPP